jgi:DNA-binding MarR family transcriptional regulator
MTRRKASNIDVRKVNRINVIRAILACERISQPELTQQLEISWPTVLQNVKEHIDLGLVRRLVLLPRLVVGNHVLLHR